jgi:hypothetical protein
LTQFEVGGRPFTTAGALFFDELSAVLGEIRKPDFATHERCGHPGEFRLDGHSNRQGPRGHQPE